MPAEIASVRERSYQPITESTKMNRQIHTQSLSLKETLSAAQLSCADAFIPAGTTAIHDLSEGDLIFTGILVNEGTIEIRNSHEHGIKQGSFQLAGINNSGHIRLDVESFEFAGLDWQPLTVFGAGSITANNVLHLKADGRLVVKEMSLKGQLISLLSKSDTVDVFAHQIDGPVSVCGKAAVVGVQSGDLQILSQTIDDDPIWFSHDGSVSVDLAPTALDFVAAAGQDVTINSGSSVTAGGQIKIAAGVAFSITIPETPPVNEGGKIGDIIFQGASGLGGNVILPSTVLSAAGPVSVEAHGDGTATGNVTVGVLASGSAAVTVVADGLVQADDLTTVSGPIAVVSNKGKVTTGNIVTSGPNGGNVTITAAGEITLAQIDTHGTTGLGGKVSINHSADAKATIGDINANSASGIGGSVDVSARGDLVTGSIQNIGTAVQSGEHVQLFVDASAGASITVNGDISSSNYILMQTPFTFLPANKIKLTGSTSTKNANIILLAGGNISTGSVTIDNSQAPSGRAGAIEICPNIFASDSAGTTLFTIGGSSENGVNGTLRTFGQGGGSIPNAFKGGLRVANRGTGGITVQDSSNISISNSEKNGILMLDAAKGNLTLPDGSISADGGSGGGFIALIGNKVTCGTSGGTTISASDSGSGLSHLVIIAAPEINYSGDLAIKADGGGAIGNEAYVALLPAGALVITSDHNPLDLVVSANFPNRIDGTNAPLTINGSGALNLSANGSANAVKASGYPLTFNGGPLNITSKGNKNTVNLTYSGGTSGIPGLVLNKQTTINANGSSGSGGNVNIFYDNIASPAQLLTISADGDGDKDGGLINIFDPSAAAAPLELGKAAGSFLVSAKGVSGTGAGGAFQVSTPNRPLIVRGQADLHADQGRGGVFNLLAVANDLQLDGFTINVNGGTKADSRAGDIQLNSGGTLTLKNTVQVTADSQDPSGSGSGGSIQVTAKKGDFSRATFSANSGQKSGSGTIKVTTTQDLNLTTGVRFSATNASPPFVVPQFKAIDFNVGGPLTIGKDTKFLASAGTGDDAYGGNVKIVAAGISVPSTGVVINCSGGLTGGGGELHLEDTAIGTTALLIDAVNGMKIDVSAGPSSGNGGVLELIAAQRPVTIADKSLSAVTGPGGGDGGSVKIQAGSALNIAGDINVNGRVSGKGGSIDISCAGTATFTNASLLANAATPNDDAGTISVKTTTSQSALQFLAPDTSKVTTISARGSVQPVNTAIAIESESTLDILNNVLINSSGLPNAQNGAAGDILLSSSQKMTLASKILANGTGTGNGGFINLLAGELSLTGSQIQANSDGTNASPGPRGKFAIVTSVQGSSSGKVTIDGGTGPGKDISVRGFSATVPPVPDLAITAVGGLQLIGTVVIDASSNVSASSSDPGAGGFVSLDVTQALDVSLSSDSKVLADGHGTGPGGVISLLNTYDNNADILLFSKFNLSAKGGSSGGRGGTIDVTSPGLASPQGRPLTVTSKDLDVSASGNDSDGGKISLKTPSLLTILGTVSVAAAQSGTGKGGTLILSCGLLTSVAAAQLIADGGDAGPGGKISLIGKGPVALLDWKGQMTSRGGISSGQTGQIVIQGDQSVTVDGRIDLTGVNPTAAGGSVTIYSGQSSLTAISGQLLVKGVILADSGSANQNAGAIALAYDGSAPNSAIVLQTGALISANAADPSSPSTGAVTFRNNTSLPVLTNLNVRNAATSDGSSVISAVGGLLDFNQGNGSVTVNVGTLTGKVLADGTAVNISVNSISDLTLGQIGDAANTGKVSLIQQGTGNIVQLDGTIDGNKIEITTQAGSAGTSTKPLQTTGINNLSAQTSQGATGSVYVVNNTTGVLTIPDQVGAFGFFGGAFSVVSNHGINVGALTAGFDASNGNLGVSIVANAGQLNVLQTPNTAMNAGGSIVLQGGNKVVISANSRVAGRGLVAVSVGRPAIASGLDSGGATDPNRPINEPVPATSSGGRVYWGSGRSDSQNTYGPGIQANAPVVQVDAIGSTIVFDANSSAVGGASRIQVAGGVAISAN